MHLFFIFLNNVFLTNSRMVTVNESSHKVKNGDVKCVQREVFML